MMLCNSVTFGPSRFLNVIDKKDGVENRKSIIKYYIAAVIMEEGMQ